MTARAEIRWADASAWLAGIATRLDFDASRALLDPEGIVETDRETRIALESIGIVVGIAVLPVDAKRHAGALVLASARLRGPVAEGGDATTSARAQWRTVGRLRDLSAGLTRAADRWLAEPGERPDDALRAAVERVAALGERVLESIGGES